ncbi:hypothetical protein A2U01_0055960, partial [Trifolium medium]|nr:hypothetical protein [Trifolium medium]
MRAETVFEKHGSTEKLNTAS